ncbi:MAG: hypothetical protein ABIK62_06640, partial [candidate division WOR-3 bacterium]
MPKRQDPRSDYRVAARNLALLLVALHTGAIGQSALRYEKVRLDLSLNADGSVDVIEQRVLDPGSDCSPRFAISGRGAGTVILHGIYAWNQDSWQELSPLRVSRSGTTLRAELRARPPGLGRSYLLEYTLTEAVRRYDRTAELNWRLMEQGLGAVQLLIIEACLPQADARITSARLFLARCAEHNIRTEPGRVLLVAGPVSFAEPIDLQLAAPAELFATSPVRTGLPQSLRPYRPVFSSSGAPRIAGIILVALGILLLVAPLVYVISLNLRFRAEPDVAYYARYERSPPRPAAPAVVPAILNPTVRSPDFPRLMFGGLVATLLDLVRQRIVTLTRAAGALTEFRLTDPARVETLDPIPRSIARLFFSNISGGEPSLTVSQVANFLRYHSSFLRAYLGHYGAAATDWWRQELDVPWLVRPAVPKLGKFIVLTLGTSILGLVLVLFGRQLQSLPLTSLEELMRQIALISLSALPHPLILLVPAVIFGA